jgi:hypothetical protein
MTDTSLARDRHNKGIQALAPGTVQVVAYTGTAARTTNALATDCVVVRLVSSTDCYIKIGTGSPTATTSDVFLPASTPEYFKVSGESTLKISAIQSSASGNLNVCEMT